MVGKSLCVVKVVPRGWKGKIFHVQPAVPNTLIALHRRHARQLQWTAASSGSRYCLYVHHDDAEREYAYDRKDAPAKLDKGWDEAVAKGWTYTLLSLVAGWWGFPWGFIYTPMAVATNLGGGRNVTELAESTLDLRGKTGKMCSGDAA